MADAITRVSYYFPTHALCAFQIITNLFINDNSSCDATVKGLVVAAMVIFCFICLLSAFTDTYTTTTGELQCQLSSNPCMPASMSCVWQPDLRPAT